MLQADTHGTEVLVSQPEEPPPPAKMLGQITIGHVGMPDLLGYDDMAGTARIEVRRVTGNGLHVTSHIKTSLFGSSCHQIEDRILCFTYSVYARFLPDRCALRNITPRFTSVKSTPATLPDTSPDFPIDGAASVKALLTLWRSGIPSTHTQDTL